MDQKTLLLKAFKSGMLQKLILKEILKTLPKEDREKFRKEGVPDEIKAEIDNEINKQLLAAGIPEETIKELNG